MVYTLLLILAILGYLLATALIAKTISASNGSKSASDKHVTAINTVFIVASISALLHLIYAIKMSLIDGSINFSLSSMTCLMSLILTVIFLLGSLTMPIRSLGILVFPLTAISLIFSYLWGFEVGQANNTDFAAKGSAFALHILISLLAYSLLSIAAIQALLYVYQERLLKRRTASTMLLTLPPLQTMELLLFRLVTVGFVLLSFTLLSGAIFSQEIFSRAFTFNHHTVFGILGWLVFATLLYKRQHHGLRGSLAVIWTLAGFILIQLGYFGTKIITESLNIQ